MTDGQPKLLFEFGPFCVDTRERVLMRSGMPVPVTPKVFDILLALVENRGHTVSKDELIDRVWPDAFVEIGNLNRNISTLRSILGDDTRKPLFIKTFPKLGYRFEAEVREIIEDEDVPVVEKRHNPNREPTRTTTIHLFRRRKIVIVLTIAAGIGIVSLGWAYTNRNGSELKSPSVDRLTGNTEAFDLYKKGRHLWQDRTGESLHEATLFLEQAVAIDPSFALGHAALADAYAFDGRNMRKAIDAANAAIALDPTLGEPHGAIGFVKMFWEWKFEEADEHFKQAISLSPNYATGHQWYAINMQATGQGNGALAEIRTALALEPDSLAINADMCQILYFNRRLDEAEVQCLKTLEMDPKFLNANLVLYDIYSANGMHNEAVAQFFRIEELVVHYAAFPGKLDELKNAYSKGGINAYWKNRVDMLKELPGTEYLQAKYYARLDEKEKVFERLTKARENNDPNFMNVLAEPLFYLCCYTDPRYLELRERVLAE